VFPPLLAILSASAPVVAAFGSAPLRVYTFGAAPASDDAYYAVPYAVFQTVFGSPENYLGETPDMDRWGVQIDVYARDTTPGTGARNARNGAKAIRDALEPVAYVTSWDGETRDTETQLFRYTFTVSFLTPRT
jgi:hypothetical protein